MKREREWYVSSCFRQPTVSEIEQGLFSEFAESPDDVAAGIVSVTRGAAKQLEHLDDSPLIRYPHDFFLPAGIWELRHSLAAYDAAYVALAEVLDTRLLTCDEKRASAPGHRRLVEVV